MRVGYFHHYGLGDNVVVLKALFALKQIYNADVIIFGNTGIKNLFEYCDFVDECVDIGWLEQKHIELISTYNLDYAILSNPRKSFIEVLEKCKIGTIITGLKPRSLISSKCKVVPTHLLPKYRNMPMSEIHCSLVRKINHKLYDAHIAHLESPYITTLDTHKEHIRHFLANMPTTPPPI